MNRRRFISISSLITGGVLSGGFLAHAMSIFKQKIEIRLLRNATVIIKIGGVQFLVDPMLSAKEQLDPIPWSNNRRNPLVDLPISSTELETIIQRTDVVLLTHLHPDHWDTKATELIPKSKLIICQPQDGPVLRREGFQNVISDSNVLNRSVIIERVSAQHGRGELLEKMSPASGYIIKSKDQTIYITGDTVWGESLRKNISHCKPDIIIANSGAAQFNFGDAITLTAEDIVHIAASSKPNAKLIVVHMEAINHCLLQRKELNTVLKKHAIDKMVIVPNDGDTVRV